MTTRRPSGRKADTDTQEAPEAAQCSHGCGGELVALTEPAFKIGRRECSVCGCSFHWNGANLARGAACPLPGALPPVAATDPPTPTEPDGAISDEAGDGDGTEAEGDPAAS